MKKTKFIGITIFILVICLLGIIYFVVKLSNDSEIGSSNQIDVNNLTEEEKENLIMQYESSEKETNTSILDENVNKEGETGNAKYSKEQLNQFSFEITGLTNEVKKYISDVDKFKETVKEYIYLNGLVDATAGNIEKYEYQENTNRFGMKLSLNNNDEDALRIIINLDTNKIDISEY